MSDTVSTSSPQWLNYYHQALPGLSGGKTDSIGAMSLSPEPTLSPSGDSSKTGGGSSPKNALKPIRRRSRASKRTPTTHLNANPTNFRALVQQFTGCPSASLSLEAARGPVTLDFGRGDDENNFVLANPSTVIDGQPFGRSYNHYQYQLPQQHQQFHQEQQQRIFPFDNNNTNAENGFFSTSCSTNYMESCSGNFDVDGTFWQDVPRDYSSVIEDFNHGN